MLCIKINDTEVACASGTTIMQACDAIGVEIPRFCYHERLKISGNCRMCLVQVEGSQEPVASCTTPIEEGMHIKASGQSVSNYREAVLEFLLINHPLDCPTCDKAGECDLQDQAFKYGKNVSRYKEEKRTYKRVDMGPLIHTEMNRCIHCSRCVKFCTDVAGTGELGTSGRGEKTEVVTYLGATLKSELVGNVIDLCPVGALTAKPYRLSYRSWELKTTPSIDVFDALGSHINVDYKKSNLVRIRPKECDYINQEWISNKARFAFDGLKYQRLTSPMVRKNGCLEKISWLEAFKLIADKLADYKSKQLSVYCGPLADCESIFVLKNLFSRLGCKSFVSGSLGNHDTNFRGNYLFNTTVQGVELADFCLLVGSDLRRKASVLGARIGQMQRSGKMKVARIGSSIDQYFRVEELGFSVKILEEILDGSSSICQEMEKAARPMMVIGDNIFRQEDSAIVLGLIYEICKKYGFIRNDWNGFNVLHGHANSVGLLDLGFNGFAGAKLAANNFVYVLNDDEIDMRSLEGSFVVYQGHHLDKAANVADLLLPACAFAEKEGTYVNLEGRAQRGALVVPAPGKALDDRQILLDLASFLSVDLGYKTLKEIRSAIQKSYPFLVRYDETRNEEVFFNHSSKKLTDRAIFEVESNYYMDNVICRASPTMLKCAKEIA